MKIKRYNELNETEQLNEGVWASPKSQEEGQKYIDELKEYKDRVYHVFGSDDVFNGLDNAILSMEKWLKDIE